MPSLKALRKRIATARSTQQITTAMRMVAAAKPRRAGGADRARPYAAKVSERFAAVAAGVEPEAHPLLARRPEQRIDLLVLTSDRGLCGGYNQNLLRLAAGLGRRRRRPSSSWDGRVSSTIAGARRGWWRIARASSPRDPRPWPRSWPRRGRAASSARRRPP